MGDTSDDAIPRTYQLTPKYCFWRLETREESVTASMNRQEMRTRASHAFNETSARGV